MTGHIEPIAQILRIGGAYGERYSWAAFMRHLSPTEVELMGVDRAPTPTERRAARVVLKAAGVTKVHICRYYGEMRVQKELTK